jgi:hypothetical protein
VTRRHSERRKAGYATFKPGDHGVGGRHATSRLVRVPPLIARHLCPRLFELRYSGGEAHPKRAVRYPALTHTTDRWHDLIMTGFEHVSRTPTRIECDHAQQTAPAMPRVVTYPSPVYPAVIGLDRLKFESVA